MKKRAWTKLKETIISYIACSTLKNDIKVPPSDLIDSPSNKNTSVPFYNNVTPPVSSIIQPHEFAMKDSQIITFALKDTSHESKHKLESSKTLVQKNDFVSYSDIIAEYQLSSRPIGTGTFAVVYKGVGTKDGKDYGLKFVNKKVLDDFGDCYHLVEREINLLKTLKHDNCISLYKTFETKEAIVLVTDFAHGGELFSRFYEVDVFTEDDASKLMKQLLKGLVYLHDQGIVHRDIKPENLLLKDNTSRLGDSQLLIADFGLANSLPKKSELLQTACGTPHFVAPEVLIGEGYSTPVDLWSCGIVLYFLLSGYTPYQGSDQFSLMESIKHSKLQFLEEDWKNVSSEARDLISLLLNPDPEKRITARQALKHPWLSCPLMSPGNLQPKLVKNRDTQKLIRSAVVKLRAAQQFNSLLLHFLSNDSPSRSFSTLNETPTITL
ncbi:hypothetical protein DSO57_1005275 [Entomophthora muscae]|uniref:Uncharacterized protein n=1 Tax=Entomophthora muscae TaxID=34485 RepID=A0ACC2SWX2_9FUNG|nr:hypothetical protein DSO57_1005275 [Entomophthora muscae]